MAAPLEKLVITAAENSLPGYRIVDDTGGDRHGAWEWMWWRRYGDRRLTVTIAVAASGGETTIYYDLEVWAGAEQGLRFGRARIGEISRIPDRESDAAVSVQLTRLVEAARAKAENFPANEISGEYREFDRPT